MEAIRQMLEWLETDNRRFNSSKFEVYLRRRRGQVMKLELTREEIALALSALTYDTQGRHGDGRGEAIASLINKIKKGAK
jgi:hypothetical protein